MKYTFAIFVWCVLIVIEYFLFDKKAFNGLLKVMDIQNIFWLDLDKNCKCVINKYTLKRLKHVNTFKS